MSWPLYQIIEVARLGALALIIDGGSDSVFLIHLELPVAAISQDKLEELQELMV